MALIIPANYDPHLTVRETQEAIKYIRDTFQKEFGKEMHLERISAPLFVTQSSGLNDNLNGVERPVQFDITAIPGETVEVVHSLAKWKRMALKEYGFNPGEGLYTNMNAIRRDEELDNLHSCYVDQWDWEKVITKGERTIETLESTVQTIFKIIKHMEHEVWYKYPQAVKHLPEHITFITTQELADRYPDKTPKERENLITKEYGCVFLMKIGDKLTTGEPHDGRAPDYDDWQLNGDILFWYEQLNCALEISSMGIRVDEAALEKAVLEYDPAVFSGDGDILLKDQIFHDSRFLSGEVVGKDVRMGPPGLICAGVLRRDRLRLRRLFGAAGRQAQHQKQEQSCQGRIGKSVSSHG